MISIKPENILITSDDRMKIDNYAFIEENVVVDNYMSPEFRN